MQNRRRFGRFEIRPGQRDLVIDGCPAALGARAFDVLVALAERCDRVVTKDELLDIVWPGVVVEENNLAVHVSALRKLLGPQAIVTIPGRGYRLVVPAEGAAAPAVPSVAPTAVDLPPLATMLLGRDDDLAALDELLRRSRCVSVVGAGGIGKTTLALAAAHACRANHRDGAAWVELAEVVDPARIPAAIAQAVGVEIGAAADPVPALVGALAPLSLLLVIDNAEHVLDAVAQVASAVLRGVPDVRLVVTSQAPLRIDGEQVFRLGPLAVPEPGTRLDQARAHGAVALFAERAQAADRRFALTGSNVETVIALCRALDGVPLAIKLAAARLPLFGLQGLAARLGDCLHLLRGGERGTPARQQTLLAALDWSHGLLEPAAQAVFRRLGVFAGGFPLGMAGAVAGDEALDEWAVIDTLGSLVDRSLVAVEGGEEPRYRLLEAVRDYARLRLDAAGETHAVQGRHAHATAALVDAAYEAYWMQPDRAWLDRYAPDLDNVRTALDWATRCEPLLGLRLIGGASVLFMLLGQAPEARRRQAALDAQAQAAEPGRCTARYWLERSRLHWGVANDAMHRYATLALAQSRAAGDQRGVYLALRCITGSDVEHADAAHAALAEMASLEQPDWPPRLRGQRLLAEVGVLRAARRMEEACEVSSALLAMATHAGVDSLATAALAGLAGIRLALGQTDEALRCARELIADPRARRGNFVLHAFGTMATAHLMTGDLAPARQAVASFIAASRGRDWEWLGLYAHVFAWLAACEGRAADAARLVGHAEEAVRRVGVQGPVSTWARTQALSLIEPALGAATLGSLKAEGARLDQASVGALALAASQRPL